MNIRPQQLATDTRPSNPTTQEEGQRPRKRTRCLSEETAPVGIGHLRDDDVLDRHKNTAANHQPTPQLPHGGVTSPAQSPTPSDILSWSQLKFETTSIANAVSLKREKAFNENLPYILAGKSNNNETYYWDGASVANDIFNKMPYPGIIEGEPEAWARDTNSYTFYIFAKETNHLGKVGIIQKLLEGGMTATMAKSMLLINDISGWEEISNYYAEGERRKGLYLYAWLVQKGHLLPQDNKLSAEIMKVLSKDDAQQAQADLLVECASKDATQL